MSDYVLVRRYNLANGAEGHGPPLMSMGEQEAKALMLSLAHSSDGELCIYRVPSLYEMFKSGPIASERLTLAEMCPPSPQTTEE